MQASLASKGRKHKYVPAAKAKGAQAASFKAKDPMQSALSEILTNKRPADYDDSDSEVELFQKKLKKSEEEEDEESAEEGDQQSDADSDDEGNDSDDEGGDDSDSEYEEPAKKGEENGRTTFGKALRYHVISQSPQNKDGHYVCAPCGMPLMTEDGVEIQTYRTMKANPEKGRNEGERQYMVAGQLDHYPVWVNRYEALKKKGATKQQIKDDHDDPTRLRALCLRCNPSHKFERVKNLPSKDYSEEQYESDDSERDEEIWKAHRK